MSIVRGPVSVWKRRALLKCRFPAYEGELEKAVDSHFDIASFQFSDPIFCQEVFSLYLKDIEPFDGLPKEARQKVLAEFGTSKIEKLNWHLTHAWLTEFGKYEKLLEDTPHLRIQEMYRDLDKSQQQQLIESWESREALFFFNDVSADARFEYWTELSLWEPEEAAALSLGKDPKIINRKQLKKKLGSIYNNSLFVSNYIERVELISRAVKVGSIKSPINPAAFLSWAEDTGLEIPAELVFGNIAKLTERKSKSSVSIEHKQLVSTYKIIVGLAEHLSAGATHKEASSIAKALHLVDVPLTQETVKKIISEAKSYISE